MNRNLIKILSILMMIIVLSACKKTPIDSTEVNDDGYIMLVFNEPKTGNRDTSPDSEIESALTHLDVLMYKKVGYNFESFYHERIDVTQYPDGTAYLKRKKEDFEPDAEYKIYVIANSTMDDNVFKPEGSSVISHDKLLELDQIDKNIHLSGIVGGDNVYPKFFLMDGVAYMGDIEPRVPGTIVINKDDVENIIIKVKLRRAAAKYVIKIFPSENVRFNKQLLAQSKGYMMRNMPIRTRVVAEGNYPDNNPAYWETSTISQSPYFEFVQEDENNYYLRITLYCYSHKWLAEEFFDKGTSLVFMLPIFYKENDKETEYINNYYQMVMNKKENGEDYNHRIKRNTLYELHVKVNAPGAEDYTEAEELEDINYFAAPWTDVDIDIEGGSTVAYLKVNKNLLHMHNIEEDNLSIYFSSSSSVTTQIVNGSVYYYNKYGVKTLVDPNIHHISATTNTNSTSGNIKIRSDIPTNNTILHFTIRVTNQEGLYEDIEVEQYPLAYITNSLPWYSYREDFYYRQGEGHTFTNCNSDRDGTNLPTTYSYAGDMISSVAVKSVNTTTHTVTYTYNRDAGSSRGFFTSKYRGNNYGNNKYYNNFYYWERGSNWWGSGTSLKSSQCENNSNLRNYHIRIMATSEEYILGRPRLDENGCTASDPENAKLVSPSFVIASRLGAVYSTSGGLEGLSEEQKRIVFADHAKHYVEVDDIDDAKDPNRVIVYDDWRLPTEAELKIIIELQGSENQDADAVDFLLNGAYYMSASGPVYNPKHTNGSINDTDDVAIRCVRDVYY
ncbi:MAG: DUF1566 domain-containing protein [Lentimicrobiaceae bacterium]|nr:DUF1566 domain-containing protein [Lentimicrobiaceae bacterium]